MTKLDSIYQDFKKALLLFEEILKEEKTEIVRNSAIKRFELAFDLTWNTVKAFLEENHNTTCVSLQSCFREAFSFSQKINLSSETVRLPRSTTGKKIKLDLIF